ncbi:4-amino-4-deoxy-L-arabinose transferase [Nocardioides sp.]|uniref:uridine kinase family protein n=1 Tax=Nocardioides sp. TaxID=35761 RepID=UPI002BABD6A5|nr:4-amino-4-deoxy-L-arabinose transferase [Nocardioides sp.]HSX69089.1 4-amino-4-deoxy-L-arabinose transferase [Nocardioides sp.]
MSDATAQQILDLTLSREPTLGAGRLLAIDGPSGSGKSTLASAIAATAPAHLTVRTLPLDLLYAGWSGLPALGGTLDALLRPLAAGRPGEATTWDWEHDQPGDELVLAPTDLLIVEGVGAGHRRVADLVTVLVWLGTGYTGPGSGPTDGTAGSAVLLERALHRDTGLHPAAAADPSAYRARLEAWQRAEAAHFAVDAPEERADLSLG